VDFGHELVNESPRDDIAQFTASMQLGALLGPRVALQPHARKLEACTVAACCTRTDSIGIGVWTCALGNDIWYTGRSFSRALRILLIPVT